MADIELVIKINEDTLKRYQESVDCEERAIIVHGTPLPKGHGRLIDGDKVENITWQEPYYHDALNVLTKVRDKVRELPTIIEADKE